MKQLDDIELYHMASLYKKLFDKGIREAKEVNHKNGLPNVFTRNGRIFYELPNGDIVDKNPLDEPK